MQISWNISYTPILQTAAIMCLSRAGQMNVLVSTIDWNTKVDRERDVHEMTQTYCCNPVKHAGMLSFEDEGTASEHKSVANPDEQSA